MSRKTVKKSRLKERLHKIFGHIMVIIAVVVVIGVFGGAYFFVIAPNLISKPFIEKPSLPGDAVSKINDGEVVIGLDHINYVVNEIGSYKLHNPFGTKNYPIMEFVLTDVNGRFYTYVKDNIPITKEGNAKNEDIIIKGSQETVFNILQSEDVLVAVKEAKDNGRVQVTLVADMATLARKGYLSLYDSLK